MRKRLTGLIICIVLTVIATGTGMMIEEKREMKKQIEHMDAMELHYDADDWFVLIYEDTGLCGVYKACTPIMHKYLTDPPYAGLYKASELDLNLDVPDWTPVLVR